MSVEQKIDPPPFLFVETSDAEAIAAAEQILHEGRWYELDKGWRVRTDGPHTTGMKLHNHVYLRQKQMAVVNRDGTASHSSDLSVLPKWVVAAMKDQKFLEGLTMPTFADGAMVVPAEVMADGFARITALARLTRLAEQFGGR